MGEAFLDFAEAWVDQVGTCVLYSGGNHDAARCSYLAVDCAEVSRRTDSILDVPKKGLPWFGYLAYELGGCSDPLDRIAMPLPSIPLSHFYQPKTLFRYEEGSMECLGAPTARPASLPVFVDGPSTLLEHSDCEGTYCAKVDTIREMIRAGDVYQVNLSQSYRVRSDRHPWLVFRHLTRRNPAAFMAYINCGDHVILSSSPERLLRKQGQYLETRPIKGTVPRGVTDDEDRQLRRQLIGSAKDRAELLMITDLMRNDLSKVCIPGTVHCPELFRCEGYENVYHLVSIVKGEMEEGRGPIDALRAVFPGGSISGCPKLAALEAIAALEQRPRGIYTGSIGYLSSDGDFDFNIAIRSMLWRDGVYELQVGGAIVIDSDPRAEWEETLHKGASMFAALGLTHEEVWGCAASC